MKSLSDCRFYGIIDFGYVVPAESERVAAEMIAGGVDIIQLRGKKQTVEELVEIARPIETLTSSAGVPLIANDHVEIAREVAVQGVHVGQDDESVATIRQKAGRPIIVGKSTHSLDQARAGVKEGADYIGFGPLFATPTKPDYPPIGIEDIRQAHQEIAIPIFCIGGIKLENLEQVIAAGAQRVVIVSGLLQAGDLAGYAKRAKALLPNPKSKV